MAFERFFKDLSYGHEFFIDQGFGLATIIKTSCPEFYVATVIAVLNFQKRQQEKKTFSAPSNS